MLAAPVPGAPTEQSSARRCSAKFCGVTEERWKSRLTCGLSGCARALYRTTSVAYFAMVFPTSARSGKPRWSTGSLLRSRKYST